MDTQSIGADGSDVGTSAQLNVFAAVEYHASEARIPTNCNYYSN